VGCGVLDPVDGHIGSGFERGSDASVRGVETERDPILTELTLETATGAFEDQSPCGDVPQADALLEVAVEPPIRDIG
jgi:hypothetical protein